MNDLVLTILEELTGTDEVRSNPDINLFEESLMDSLNVVELLVELEEQCDVNVAPSDFDKAKWSTPNMIIEQALERAA
ncbi:MAG: D-alanine--poly(phosphoribitol) ligase subunit DltC [Clostridiales Family XIII bacterium]|nr:D-alanine--poly(phosphoribitol) ligase subunit DltC [Clostridiales Family XIII bacterium]